jgi:hypothetical protein
MTVTSASEKVSNLSQTVENSDVVNYFLQGTNPSPADIIQDTEAQDTVQHTYGTLIKGARAPSTYKDALSVWEPVRQVQDVQLGFVADPAVQWAFSERALSSVTPAIRTWMKDYETPTDFSTTFAFAFAEAIVGRDLMRDSLSIKDEVPDLHIWPHVRLPPKSRREVHLKITKRRKGEPLPIEPEDL